MIFLGSDPDTQTPSVAGVDEQGRLVFVWSRNPVKESLRLSGREAILSSFASVQDALNDPASLLGDIRCLQTPNNDISLEAQQAYRVVGIAVEAQEVYGAKAGAAKTKSPRSMVFLANAAGAVAGTLTMCFPWAVLYFPSPQAWKGSVPKKQHHGHIYKRLGWTGKVRGSDVPYLVPSIVPEKPEGFDDIRMPGWKHVNDSIGLALWCRDEWLKRNRKKQWQQERAALESKA